MSQTKNKTPKLTPELEKILASAPEFTPEELGFKPGHVVARGFAAHAEFINRNGRPRVSDPRIAVSLRLPKSYVEKMRTTGRGWQTRLGDYLVKLEQKDVK